MYPNESKIHNKLASATSSSGVSAAKLPARNARSRSPLRGPRDAQLNPSHRMRSASFASSSSLSNSQLISSTDASTTSLQIPTDQNTHRLPSRPSTPSSLSTIENIQIKPERVMAMHDYTPGQQNATCLSFRAGQVIHVINKDPSGWWDGELEGTRGWFPSNYVSPEMDDSAQNDYAQVQPDLLSVAPANTLSHEQTSDANSFVQETDSYCPTLMIPLLHGLSLLHTAVKANRISHFPPSTACIISCVRSILSAAGALIRDSPILKQYPPLSEERREILSILAALVAQTKKASDSSAEAQNHEVEVENMLRLSGQVFANVRRFLAVAVQCGVEVPIQGGSTETNRHGPHWVNQDVPFDAPPMPYPDEDIQKQTRTRGKDSIANTGPLRTKNMTDRSNGDKVSTTYMTPSPPRRLLPHKPKESNRTIRSLGNQHRQAVLSISSTSSSSSFSSQGSTHSAASFPSGPLSTMQVMEALRVTHDQYLSTIAAFIGHAHSHSRTSHASSTGHLYDLVREVVEMVCRLLTIVGAVMQHPDISVIRMGNLKSARDGLYNVTNSLAESVQLLTSPLPSTLTEEEEKLTLLRSATAALKAGADCVAAVKLCLSRSISERPFIINLSIGNDGAMPTMTEALSGIKPSSAGELFTDLVSQGDEDNKTIQAFPASSTNGTRDMSSSSEGSTISVSSSLQSVDTAPTSPDDTKYSHPFTNTVRSEVEPDLPSPASMSRTDDDGTKWEESVRAHKYDTLQDEDVSQGLNINPEFLQDPATWMLSHDHSLEDVAYNSEGHLVGATMQALVEKMTPHDSVVDQAFSAVFFMTFRLFCSPVELVDTIISRYNIKPPDGLSDEDVQLWQQRKGVPVRLRVSNFIKLWVEMYWRPAVDHPALQALTLFIRSELMHFFPGPAQRILELVTLRSQTTDYNISPKGDRSRDPGMSINPPSAILLSSEVPRPIISKNALVALRRKDFTSIAVTDFDALELARQLTIMECNLYCTILPDEVLETGSEGAKPSVNVKAVSSLSTVITGWVAESILNELDLKKRTALVRFFVKVADRCSGLNNFSTSRSILAALDSSTISRLHLTWMGIPQKCKSQMESLRRLADHSRNYHEYRTKLRNTAPPAVPFLGLYLTDVTFCREGNPSHRASPIDPSKKLLNFNKYHKLARIIQDMQRFQVPYNLKAISEVQEYLNVAFENARKHGDFQDLYRRSLLLEPRQPADAAPTSDVRHIFNWTTRSQSQTTAPIS